ncbi:hypothetical protein FRC00_002554 [Tulasnella sp. 408]|nr:hypothetical protein FRC00_002554 [Tulasnella sp. 408]
MIYTGFITRQLTGITNIADLQVELDLDSIIDGDPRFRDAEQWEFRRSPAALSQLRKQWESNRRSLPKVSWVAPSDEVEGSWERIGGADLSFDDAIVYLDRRREGWLKAYGTLFILPYRSIDGYLLPDINTINNLGRHVATEGMEPSAAQAFNRALKS